MKKGIFHTLYVLIAFSSLSTLAATLSSIDFHQVGEISRLELTLDVEGVKSKSFNVTKDKQIIIDLKDTVATRRVMRAFDTSEFSGSVVFVSAYKKPDSKNDLRVAIQLRDNVRSHLKYEGKKLIIEIENRYGVFTKAKVQKEESYRNEINALSPDEVGKVHIPATDSVEDILHNMTLSGRKRYIGKRITINVRDLNVEDILKMIAESSGFNIIIKKEVKELDALTINLTDIPWDQALDTVLSLNKLVATKNGTILMVTTLEKATLEKRLELEAQKLSTKGEKLVTNVYSISYATLGDLEAIIKEYLTPLRGNISKDERTNFLIVKDTPAIQEKVSRIIKALDTQTPQVLIETKIVEVSENYKTEIGLENGFNWGYDPKGVVPRSGSPVGSKPGSAQFGGPGFTMSSAPSKANGTAFGLLIGRMGRVFDLEFNLQLMESEAKGKIISAPKVITQNKKAAKIKTFDTTSYPVSTGTGDNKTITYEETSASMELEVTPQVTNELSIVLDISLKKVQFLTQEAGGDSPPDKSGREVNTSVLADNGSTIVIGGIYNFEKRESSSGIPFLKDIPMIGWLFRSMYNPQTSKNEMIIFLTPRIINQEEAGLIAEES